jgi:hypothetical protein
LHFFGPADAADAFSSTKCHAKRMKNTTLTQWICMKFSFKDSLKSFVLYPCVGKVPGATGTPWMRLSVERICGKVEFQA